MTAQGKYTKIFGKFESLDQVQYVSWPMGVSNMFEWLTWSTNEVLGITKESRSPL